MRYAEITSLHEADQRFDDAVLKARYDHFNALLFDGKLPDIPVEWAKLKTVGGVADGKLRQTAAAPSRLAVRLGANKHGGKELVPGSLRIRISSLYRREPKGIDGILVHEMIHIYFFAVEGDFAENHGTKFQALRKRLNAQTDFEIPLTDDVTGLALSDAPTRKVGVIVLTKASGQQSVAVVTEAYMRDNLDALKERWAYFVEHKYVASVTLMVCAGRIEARYPVQRKKPADLRFFVLKEPALLDEAKADAEILATIP